MDYLDSSPSRPGTVGGHLEGLRMFIHFLPPSVRCIHLQIDTGDSDSVADAKSAATGIATWRPLVNTFAAKEAVLGVVVSILYSDERRPCWSRRRKRRINRAHMLNFPIKTGKSPSLYMLVSHYTHLGSIARDRVCFYRTEAGRAEADLIFSTYY